MPFAGGIALLKPPSLSCFLICLMLAHPAPACLAGQDLTFDQLARASKTYLRDSAEFPMTMAVDFSAIDSAGHVRKHRSGKFNYDFHGYNARSGDANLNLHGPKSSMKAAVSIAYVATLSSVLLFPDIEKVFRLSLAQSAPDTVLANLTAINECPPSPWVEYAYLLTDLCGSAQVHLRKDDLSMLRFAFEGGGLPVQGKVDFLGPATIRHYHVDIEFQKIPVSADPKPFLVPKVITLTVETDKGKLVMSGDFAPKNIR
jgi:hypothetical protein